MSRLADLLNDMAGDPALEQAWKDDAEAVMERYRLTEEEREALRRKDTEAIKRLSGVAQVKVNSTIKAYDA